MINDCMHCNKPVDIGFTYTNGVMHLSCEKDYLIKEFETIIKASPMPSHILDAVRQHVTHFNLPTTLKDPKMPKPFNLKEAQDGKEIQCEDEAPAKLVYVSEKNTLYPLLVVINPATTYEDSAWYSMSGNSLDGDHKDLCMKSVQTSRWINVYKATVSGEIRCAHKTYRAQDLAAINSHCDSPSYSMEPFNHIAICKIEIEE